MGPTVDRVLLLGKLMLRAHAALHDTRRMPPNQRQSAFLEQAGTSLEDARILEHRYPGDEAVLSALSAIEACYVEAGVPIPAEILEAS